MDFFLQFSSFTVAAIFPVLQWSVSPPGNPRWLPAFNKPLQQEYLNDKEEGIVYLKEFRISRDCFFGGGDKKKERRCVPEQQGSKKEILQTPTLKVLIHHKQDEPKWFHETKFLSCGIPLPNTVHVRLTFSLGEFWWIFGHVDHVELRERNGEFMPVRVSCVLVYKTTSPLYIVKFIRFSCSKLAFQN